MLSSTIAESDGPSGTRERQRAQPVTVRALVEAGGERRAAATVRSASAACAADRHCLCAVDVLRQHVVVEVLTSLHMPRTASQTSTTTTTRSSLAMFNRRAQSVAEGRGDRSHQTRGINAFHPQPWRITALPRSRPHAAARGSRTCRRATAAMTLLALLLTAMSADAHARHRRALCAPLYEAVRFSV